MSGCIAIPVPRRGSRGGAAGAWILLATLFAGLLGIAVPAGAAEPTPAKTAEERVQEISDDVLALIEAARGYAKDEPERFYREFTALLDPAVDFESFARSVMAVHYRSASPEQRQRFADSFKWGLVRTYALALTEFSNGTIRVLPATQPPRNPRMHSVRMEVVTPSGNVYPVQYAMGLGRDGEWRVRNIIVNGVNMGLTYRSQFAGAMKDPANGGSLDKVIDGWSDMLKAEAEELEATLSGNAQARAGQSA